MKIVTVDMLDDHLRYDHDTGELFYGDDTTPIVTERTGLIVLSLPTMDDGEYRIVKLNRLTTCWRMAYGDKEGDDTYVTTKNGRLSDTRLSNLQLVFKHSAVRKQRERSERRERTKAARQSYPPTIRQWGVAFRDRTKKAFAARLLKEALAAEARKATISAQHKAKKQGAEDNYQAWKERRRQEEIAWRREAGLRD